MNKNLVDASWPQLASDAFSRLTRCTQIQDLEVIWTCSFRMLRQCKRFKRELVDRKKGYNLQEVVVTYSSWQYFSSNEPTQQCNNPSWIQQWVHLCTFPKSGHCLCWSLPSGHVHVVNTIILAAIHLELCNGGFSKWWNIIEKVAAWRFAFKSNNSS